MIIYADNGHTTFCPDTPANWAYFERLKRALDDPSPRRIAKQDFNQGLNAQISKENKKLRELRTFLPGYEPDRFAG